MADIEREDLVSWVLYAVRATFEEESTRNNILKLFLLDNSMITLETWRVNVIISSYSRPVIFQIL